MTQRFRFLSITIIIAILIGVFVSTSTHFVFAQNAVRSNASIIITLGCGPKDIDHGSYLNTCYQPTVLIVKPGTTVTWRNDDTSVHSVTDGNAWVYYSVNYFFESATLQPGETFSYQYNYPGAYPYFDSFNPWETGLVIVEK